MPKTLSRRDFLKVSGTALLGSALHPGLREGRSEPRKATSYDVVVIGAGIAGLTAASFLEGRDIRVLEKATRAGGRVMGGQYKGFSYAKGAEYLGEPQGAWGKMVKKTGLKSVEIPAPMDAIFRDGKIYTGVSGIARYLIENSSLKEYNRFAELMLKKAKAYDEQDEFDPESDLGALDRISAHDWFEKEKIPQVIYDAYNVSCRGLFGASLAEVSALSVLPEFGFDFEGFSALKTIPNAGDEEEGSGAYTFVHGIAEMTDALAAELGDKLICGADVISVERSDDTYNIVYRDEKGGSHHLAAEAVILGVPAPVVLKIAANVLSREQKNLLEKIPYAQYITAALMSDTPLFNQAFDLALPDGRFLTDLYDSTWVERAYDPEARQNDAWIATAYIAGRSYTDQTLVSMKDEEVLRRLSRDLADVIPNLLTKVKVSDIQRFAYAYPVLVPGGLERVARLQEINGENELSLAGDYMAYPTFEDAADTGYEAAQNYLT